MLTSLSIRDIVLIEKLDLSFHSGMTVLTGETGAGKSILLDALTLALGGRGDAGLVRAGAAQGQVTAVFDVPLVHPLRAVFTENGLEVDGDLILKRIQSADGRTRAFINDQPVGAGLLKSVGAGLVEIHGQHDDRALVDPAAHRALLDAFGGLEPQVSRVSAAYEAMRLAARKLKEQRVLVEKAAHEEEFLRASVEELTALSPEPGEEDQLAARRTDMMRAEKVAADLNEALEIISGNASPVPSLAGLLRRLERKGEDHEKLLGATKSALARALDALGDASQALDVALHEADFDPRELEQTEERLFALRAAARKHAVTCDALPELAARMADELDRIDAGENLLRSLEEALLRARKAYGDEALLLSAARLDTAERLAGAVNGELPDLKLGHARFFVAVRSSEETESADGRDHVEFHVQTNPGARPGPMMKVASGGELSRFLLALKVSLADRGSAPTLIFDEIDSGAGGAVAEAIGARLSRLAETVQVMSVTHAPQVAARAAHHMLIEKAHDATRGLTTTDVSALSSDARTEEIARMLAGAVISDEARAAAQKLMEGALS